MRELQTLFPCNSATTPLLIEYMYKIGVGVDRLGGIFTIQSNS